MPEDLKPSLENSFERIPPAGQPHPGQGTSTGMGGADDGNSGGGNGSGIPDGKTAYAVGDAVTRGDAQHDRETLFPGS